MKNLEDKVIETVEGSISKIIEEGLNTNNLEHLYKLSKIKHLAKEDKEMYGEYGNYGGRGPGHGSYGRYGEYGNYGNYGEGSYGEYGRGGSYGRRGRDTKYRGDDEIERMSGEYGRYQESRGRYGAGSEETDKSFHYMVKALEDFIKVLYEEADTQQQKQQLMQALQNSMR